MLKTTLPTSLFNQVSSSVEDDTSKSLINFENFNFLVKDNDNIHLILMYIGLITVILFVLFTIYSSICKCMKMFDNINVKTKKKSISLNKELSRK